jgi:hypothetical protein
MTEHRAPVLESDARRPGAESRGSGRAPAALRAEDLFYVAHFALHFAAHFFGRASVAQVRIAHGLTRFFFHFAFRFARAAFDFVFGTRSHNLVSRSDLSKVVSIAEGEAKMRRSQTAATATCGRRAAE